MRRRLASCLALIGLLAGGVWAAEGGTRVAIDDSGRFRLAGLPPVLDDAEVQRHLSSGLTTSFLFRVRPPRPFASGAARIDIRFELWDEIFLVSVLDGEGRLEEIQHVSEEALRTWWSAIEIVVSEPHVGQSGSVDSARLALDVIPFSQAELIDTQRWLAESMGQAQSGTRPGQGRGVSRAVGALIATSMQRRSVRSWMWSVPVEKRSEP